MFLLTCLDRFLTPRFVLKGDSFGMFGRQFVLECLVAHHELAKILAKNSNEIGVVEDRTLLN